MAIAPCGVRSAYNAVPGVCMAYSYYIYYRVASDHPNSCESRVLELFSAIKQATNIAGRLLKKQIPIRTFTEWTDVQSRSMTGQRPAMPYSPYRLAHANAESIVGARSPKGRAPTAAAPIHSQLFGTRFASG